jgi:[ribosomal protein S5]-alanine N-acetyltransferase
MEHQPTIETERLILRPFSISDADVVMTLAGTKQVYATTLNVPYPYEPGMAEKWISTHASQFYNGTGLTLAITLKRTGEIVGTIGIGITKQHSRAELGYWIGHEYWGNGYCTEAAKAIIEYAFNVVKLHKITSRFMEVNPASGRVMEKAGMTREGKLIDEVTKDNVYHSLIVYGKIDGEQPHAADAEERRR